MGHGSWYIDEEDPTLVRWHDGTGWTDYVLVRADWDGADGPPPPPDDPVWATPRGHVLRFAAGTAAVVLLVLVGALAVFGDGGSDDPSRGSTIGREAPDEDRPTADDLTSLGGLGADADVLGSGTSTDGELDDVGGSDGGGTTRTTRRSASGTTPTTRGSGVQRTEFRSETHTDGGSREVIGPRDDVQLGNSSATTIADRYNPPPPPPTTAAPSTTATTAPTQTDGGTTGGPTPTDGGTTGGPTTTG